MPNMREYRAGERVSVIRLPADQVRWISPREGEYLKNGDVITLADPPTMPNNAYFMRYSKYPVMLCYESEHEMCVNYNDGLAHIPVDWVEIVKDVRECKCDLMRTGCVCGVFLEEQAKKGAGG